MRHPLRRPAALLLAATALAGVTTPATQAARSRPRTATGLHDARYCEILEVRGTLPDARAIVWNTIKLNTCPAAWWTSLDAPSLARGRGDAFVKLNGPRHFLMDSVTATTGRVRTFEGQRLRRVAVLPLHTTADLVATPYAERTVARTNVWRWHRGRTLFELVAPDGRVYVMQAYAQIEDPSLTLAQLPGLGAGLDLPGGWTYRHRRLRHPFSLRARGSATILQDELENTYQRVR